MVMKRNDIPTNNIIKHLNEDVVISVNPPVQPFEPETDHKMVYTEKEPEIINTDLTIESVSELPAELTIVPEDDGLEEEPVISEENKEA